MPEFKRSRMERKNEEQITRKTVILGILTLFSFVLIIVFGLPLLIKFAVFLGDLKSSNGKEVVENVLPPQPPRLEVPFEATNNPEIEIKGVAEPKVAVELLRNDVQVAKTDVNETGEFTFTNLTLDEGDNIFTARVSTEKGLNSELSKEVVITFDDEPPALTMTNPSEESLTVDYADFDITGNTDKGTRVTVNGHVAMTDDEGGFKFKLQLGSGKNEVEVAAIDLAGNETKKKLMITYDL